MRTMPSNSEDRDFILMFIESWSVVREDYNKGEKMKSILNLKDCVIGVGSGCVMTKPLTVY